MAQRGPRSPGWPMLLSWAIGFVLCGGTGRRGSCCAGGRGAGPQMQLISAFCLPSTVPGPPPPAGHGPTLKDGWWGWGLVRGRSTCPCPRLWGRGVWRTRPFPHLRRSEKTRGSVSLEGTGLTLVTAPAQPPPPLAVHRDRGPQASPSWARGRLLQTEGLPCWPPQGPSLTKTCVRLALAALSGAGGVQGRVVLQVVRCHLQGNPGRSGGSESPSPVGSEP